MAFVPFPVRIPGLTDATAIAAGRKHGLALLKDGTVRAWGENRTGQVGDGTMVKRNAPVPVPGVRNAVAVAAGAGDLSAALLADGTVMTWGGTIEGGLGRLPYNKPSPTPALVPGVRGVRAIAVGSSHMIALTETGTVITWGANGFGSLGRPRDENVPGAIPAVTNVQSICASGTTNVVVLQSGRIMTWGGEVRPWNRPEGSEPGISRSPILFWLDGLDLPSLFS
jgi:alpha-tubulin suppressor-like RCC1 family protein